MPILNKDPNAPPDPSELKEIPDAQHPAGSDINRDNPVSPGVPPSPDNPTGVPPDPEAPPPDTGELKRWMSTEPPQPSPAPPQPPPPPPHPAPSKAPEEPKHEEPKKKK